MKRESCWNIISKYYPEKKTKYEISSDLILKSINEINSCSKVLMMDAGCGHSSGITFDLDPNIKLVGADLVFDDLKNNKKVNFRIVSDLNNIPIRDNSLDIVYSNMVIEHLPEPNKFFNEISRIVKGGGYFILATPCIYNIVVIVNKILPDWLSSLLSSWLTGKDSTDVFPAFYRANSIRKIRKLISDTEFEEVDLIMYQPPPSAFVFSEIICKIIILYYKLINKYDIFMFLRGVIIARYVHR